MTIEERVDSICRWNNPGLRAVVLEVMQAVIEEEREDCAKVCDDIESRYREREQFEETGGMSTYSADAAQRCAFAIRQSTSARSEG